MTVQIRPATPEEAAALTEIALAAKRHWGYPENWIEQWRPQLTIHPEFIANQQICVATENERPVAFYALTRNEGRVELQHLWVLPERMGRGLGRLLFTHALQRAKEWGVRELEIESDPNAAGFYERMGARRVGSRITEFEQQRRELPILVCAVEAVP